MRMKFLAQGNKWLDGWALLLVVRGNIGIGISGIMWQMVVVVKGWGLDVLVSFLMTSSTFIGIGCSWFHYLLTKVELKCTFFEGCTVNFWGNVMSSKAKGIEYANYTFIFRYSKYWMWVNNAVAVLSFIMLPTTVSN